MLHLKLKFCFFFLFQLKYKETFNAEKGQYIGSEDTPQLAHSREVNKIISEVMQNIKLLHSFILKYIIFVNLYIKYRISFFKRPCLLCVFQKHYKLAWDESKATGYQLDHEYIPLLSGKKGREIASDVSVFFILILCQ